MHMMYEGALDFCRTTSKDTSCAVSHNNAATVLTNVKFRCFGEECLLVVFTRACEVNRGARAGDLQKSRASL